MQRILLAITVFIGFCGRLSECVAQSVAAPPSDSVSVTILHSNDVYGQFHRQETSGRLLGGMAPRVHLIREQGRMKPITLDAGNALGPLPMAASDRGATMISLMKLAGYDAMLPGNHEFNYGPDILKKRLDEAQFPLLGTNLKSVGPLNTLIQSSLVLERDGVRIGIVGLVSPEVATLTNPKKVADITFEDPVRSAAAAVAALRDEGVDYVVALAHIRESEALFLGQQVPDIDLIVAGGYYGVNQPDQLPALIRLTNGVHIVITPGYGTYLGRVTAQFVRRSEGGYMPVRTDAALLTIDKTVTDDPEAETLIDALEARYMTATEDTLGYITGATLDDQARIVANLMREQTDMEIGIINRGALRMVSSTAPLQVRDLETFIRFQDHLVTMTLTGNQLRAIVTRGSQAARASAKVVYAGLNADNMTVNGRLLQNDERYQVVSTEFLANGGDGYVEFTQGRNTAATGLELRELVQQALQERGTLTPSDFRQLNRKGIWRSAWEVEGAFERNFIDQTTMAYRNLNESVSFLSGATTISWNSVLRYSVGYEVGPHATLLQTVMDFGQIGQSFGNLKKSSDQIDSELSYHYRTRSGNFDPFVSTGLNTAFTRNSGQRPILVRNSLGFQKIFRQRLLVRFAGRGQRDFFVDASDFGGEVTLEVTQPLQTGGRVTSRVRSFFGFTDRRVISIENYNTFSFPLVGALRLNVRQNNFIYRVNKIRGIPVAGFAFRTNLTVGFAYGLGWKWL